MIKYRTIYRPAFEIIGRKTWISGQDNELFGQFWSQCQEDGLFDAFHKITKMQPGSQTSGVTLGVSCVEDNPNKRSFYYFVAVEKPEGYDGSLEDHSIPASEWAVFESRGKMPDALVEAEMYAFMEWLPASGYVHAHAPEMEVYPPQSESEDVVCEFWLPVEKKRY
jgi:AraC family transcriptional regulator